MKRFTGMGEQLKEKILDRMEELGVKGINSEAGMTYAVNYFCRFTRVGIGISRRELTRATGRLSPFIHSWATYERYRGIIRDFEDFCRAEQIKKLKKIAYATIDKFLMGKIERNFTRNTIETNICALLKFLTVTRREDLRETLASDYTRFKDLAKEGRTIYAFDKPDKLIETLYKKDELAGVVAQIVRITGVRIHEVRPLLIKDNAIVVHKGKGGRMRTVDFSHRPDDLEKVRDLMERLKELVKHVDWHAYMEGTYQGHVRAAARATKDAYAGAHGLRAVFAQEEDKRLEAEGMPDEQREYAITRALGHNRRSMARHYLEA